jgi:hypothetical protein
MDQGVEVFKNLFGMTDYQVRTEKHTNVQLFSRKGIFTSALNFQCTANVKNSDDAHSVHQHHSSITQVLHQCIVSVKSPRLAPLKSFKTNIIHTTYGVWLAKLIDVLASVFFF